MEYKIPGTALVSPRETGAERENMLRAMFLGGDITLAQVAAVTGLEPHTVQNWVKRGFLTPPRGKKYSLDQLCRIININMLRGIFPLERICRLLDYMNGRLADEEFVGDADLYFMFCNLTAKARQLTRPEACDRILEEMLREYAEPFPGAKAKVSNVLKVMLTAYLAAQMRDTAEELLSKME